MEHYDPNIAMTGMGGLRGLTVASCMPRSHDFMNARTAVTASMNMTESVHDTIGTYA